LRKKESEGLKLANHLKRASRGDKGRRKRERDCRENLTPMPTEKGT